MICISQMMPGMQFIPLVAAVIGLLIVGAMVASGSLLTKVALRRRKNGAGTYWLLATVSVGLLWLILPKPIDGMRVARAAEPGITVEELIAEIGEPHNRTISDDGSMVLRYYEDCIGFAMTSVRITEDGKVAQCWF